MKETNPNRMCRLKLHKWKDYGDLVLITWSEPGFISLGSMISKSKSVYTKRKCLRCGIRKKRILAKNPDAQL